MNVFNRGDVANHIIAKNVIEERLSIPATTHNIDALADWISAIEAQYQRETV